MSEAVVAIIGRPNVGKSSFFNFAAQKRISIVDDEPGVTRDRLYADVDWQGKRFKLVDTGGIFPAGAHAFYEETEAQAMEAVSHADVILFLCDVRDSENPVDDEIALLIKKTEKPCFVVVNKCDNPGDPPPEFYSFYRFGIEKLFAVSAAHGLGMGDLLDAICLDLPEKKDEEERKDEIAVAIIGKPNAGKSSLFNKLIGTGRSIVSPLSGTTRDAIDSVLETGDARLRFIDTAGLRKKSRIEDDIERYSSLRAVSAVERSDVCLIVIDAAEGITEQDTKVAGLSHNEGKAALFLLNKWDLAGKENAELLESEIRRRFPFMSYAPILRVSALSGFNVQKIIPKIIEIYAEACKRIKTGVLNEAVAEMQAMVPAPQYKGRRLKISYAVQAAVKPPEFILFVNSRELLHFSYDRYLENRLRQNFGFEGTPIRLTFREKSRKDYGSVKNKDENK